MIRYIRYILILIFGLLFILWNTYEHRVSYESTTQLDDNRDTSSAVSGTRFRMTRKRNTLLNSNLNTTILKPLLPYYTTQCQNWVVVTSIFRISESIKDIVTTTNWCLVIVADKKSKDTTA